MKEDKISVLVTDDHTLFRKGMRYILKSFSEIGEVHEAENGQKAVDFLKDNPVDIILMDIDMPVLDGKEASKKIIAKYPDIHIIMVSMHESLEVISELIEIGVHSYILKSAQPEEIQKAILSVINNDFYYNQIVSRALHQNLKNHNWNHALENDKSQLTKREIEILALICEELTMKEIGEKLFLSEQTVHTHRKNLMKKTDAKNAVGLVRFAVQHHIVSF